MSQENKALFERVIEEVFNKGDLAVADEIIATDFIENDPMPGQESGLTGLKAMVGVFRTAFPDIHITIEDLIAEGAKVVGRVTTHGTHKGEFAGIPPTGKHVTVKEIHIVRIVNGKAAEHWGIEDTLGMMQQLGAVPEMAQTGLGCAVHLTPRCRVRVLRVQWLMLLGLFRSSGPTTPRVAGASKTLSP